MSAALPIPSLDDNAMTVPAIVWRSQIVWRIEARNRIFPDTRFRRQCFMLFNFLAALFSCFFSNIDAHKCYFDRLPENVKNHRTAQKMKECPREVKDCITITTSLEINDDWEVYIERRCAHTKYECNGTQNTCHTIEAEPVWGRRKMEKRCCYNGLYANQSNSWSLPLIILLLFLITR